MNGNNNTALVLSGGGAKGAFQVGALNVLREKGYSYDAISGVSVGALNGAMLTTMQFDELVSIWETITPGKVIRENSLFKIARQYLTYKIGLTEPPVSKYDNSPLHRLMREHLLGKQAKLPFHFGYVILETGRYVNAVIQWTGNHRIDEGDIHRVLASTAIPAIFNPSKIGDQLGVDGGIRNISPIADILPYSPERVIIIPTEPVGPEKEHEEVRDIISIAFRAINIMLDEIFNEDIDRFLTINRLVKQAEDKDLVLKKEDGTPYKYIEPIIIAPEESLGSALNFDNRNIRRMMEIGEQRAREVLNLPSL